MWKAKRNLYLTLSMVLTIALCVGRQFIGLVLVPRGGHIVLNLTRLLACGKRAKKCTWKGNARRRPDGKVEIYYYP